MIMEVILSNISRSLQPICTIETNCTPYHKRRLSINLFNTSVRHIVRRNLVIVAIHILKNPFNLLY